MNVDVIGGSSDGMKLRKTVDAGKLLFQGNVRIGSAVLSLSKNKCTVFQFYGRRLHCTFASDATCRICIPIYRYRLTIYGGHVSIAVVSFGNHWFCHFNYRSILHLNIT